MQPSPAPWFIDPPGPAEDDTVTTIEIPDGLPDPGRPPSDIGGQDWGDSGYSTEGADAIACYVPWHYDPIKWGIYFLQQPFFAFVKDIATIAGLPPGPLAPVVLRQVLFHELTHFRFEVVGSELEDVLTTPTGQQKHQTRRLSDGWRTGLRGPVRRCGEPAGRRRTAPAREVTLPNRTAA
jgi:hypothetical protein